MKIRLGFVSNSSSSSYTCELCNETQSGVDSSLEDFDMIDCEHDHIVCVQHLPEQTRSQLDDYTIENDDYGGRKLKSEVCPLCLFEHLSEGDELRYYRSKLKTHKEETRRELKKKFKDYKEFELSLA